MKTFFKRKQHNRHPRMRQIDATDKCEVYGILQKCGYFQRKFSRAPLTKEIREEFNRIGNQNWKSWLKSAGTFIWTDRRVEMLLKILCNCECYVNDVSIIERSKNQWRLFYLVGGIPLCKKYQRKAGHNAKRGLLLMHFRNLFYAIRSLWGWWE